MTNPINLKKALMVDFIPAPALTNAIIGNLNDMTGRMPPQEYATWLASQIAGIAYMMHASNSTEQIVDLFKMLVEDAGRQVEHRKKLIEKEANNPLKFKPHG